MDNSIKISNTSEKLAEKDFEIVSSSVNMGTEGCIQNKLKKKSMQIKVLRDDRSRFKILEKMKEMMESHIKLERLTKESINKEMCSEKYIKDLNNQIFKVRNESLSLKNNFNKIQQERNNLYETQKNIAEYCNDLKKKFKNFVQTIENYEKTIEDINIEKANLINYYEDQINNYDNRKKQITQENFSLSTTSKNLSNEITKYEIDTNLMLRKKEEQKEIYADRLRADKVRFDELEIKYAQLQKKMNDFESTENMKAHIERKSKVLRKTSFNDKAFLHKKIKEYENQNQKLTKRLDDLNIEIKRKIECLNGNNVASSKSINSKKLKF